MTPRDALVELVERVGARHGAAVLISEEEVRQWPADAVSAIKSHGLLTRTRPATTVVCPGCEEDCVMPVQTMPAGPRGSAPFIVCDKRSDINRVALTSERVNQWKCDAAAIARFVARRLGLRRGGRRAARSGMLEIGLAAGDTRRQMLCLRTYEDAESPPRYAETSSEHVQRVVRRADCQEEHRGWSECGHHPETPHDVKSWAEFFRPTTPLYPFDSIRVLRRPRPNGSHWLGCPPPARVRIRVRFCPRGAAGPLFHRPNRSAIVISLSPFSLREV